MTKRQFFYVSIFLIAVLLPLQVYGLGIGSHLNETRSSWNWGPEFQPYGREPVTLKIEANGEGFDQIAPKFPYYHPDYPDGGPLDSVLIAYSDQDVNYTEGDNPVFDYPGGSVYFTFLIQPFEGYAWPDETFILTAGAISVSGGQSDVGIGVHYKYWNSYKQFTVGTAIEGTTDLIDTMFPPPWKILGKQYGGFPYNSNPGLWVKQGDIIQFDSHDNQLDGNGVEGSTEKRYLIDVLHQALIGGVQAPDSQLVVFQSDNNPDGFVGGGLRTLVAPATGFLVFGINQNSVYSEFGEFTLTGKVVPQITLTNPDRFVFIYSSSVYQITWGTSGYFDDITIEYSADNGQSWTDIEPGVIKNCGSYYWTTPDVISQDCLLRLSHLATGTVETSQPFAIGDYWPTHQLTMQSALSEGSITEPNLGTHDVFENIAIDISAVQNDSYLFDGWSANPSGNAVFGDAYDSNTTVAISGDATITAHFNPVPLSSDINGDGITNFIDFSLLASRWLQPDCSCSNSWCNGTDLDRLGNVDIGDLTILSENWLKGVWAGLTHYYPFEKTQGANCLTDIVSGKDACLKWGNPVVESNGIINYGWAFDGDDAISWDDPLLPDLAVGDNFTLSMWAYNTGLTNNNDGIWSTYHTNGTDSYFLIDIYQGGLRFIGANMGMADNYEADIVSILPNQWYHYIWRKNDSEYTIFVNGVEVFSTTGNDAITWDKNVKRRFMIGSQSSVDPGDYWWNGYFDEFGVWLRSLSDQEILTLYNDGEGLSYSDIIGTE
ncbi:MAG: LamG-like jellyroll fold domain-containing protein [Planctomycetota bacterium]